MKPGDLVRWREKSLGALYPEELGVIVEVIEEGRRARIYWVQTNRGYPSMNTESLEWPLNCMELVEQ
jgi:hypothetical protein